ncbi:MAG TPA: hypothetical protein PLN83_01760 [Syntrophorhabdus sp.]|nr:hypothetical protein [Syntrophorhabdus sp.]
MKKKKHECNYVPLFLETFDPGRSWWYFNLGYPLYHICTICHTIVKIVDADESLHFHKVITDQKTIRSLTEQASAWNSYMVHQENKKTSRSTLKTKSPR